MRSFLLALGMLATLPLGAQEVGYWTADLHAATGTLNGHYLGSTGGQAFLVDLQTDLNLASTDFKVGFGGSLEYQGPDMALQFATDSLNFTGSNTISRQVTINGTNFPTGSALTSTVKTVTSDLTLTLREASNHSGWFGFDLTLHQIAVNMAAQGGGLSASYGNSLTLPMVGASAGFQLADGTVVGRAYFHALYFFGGANYTSYGADLRYFPVVWGGFRVFANMANLKLPSGSIWSGCDIALGQANYGLGGVVRF